MSLTNLNDPGEPLHITAAMQLLAELRESHDLPHPVAFRMTKSNRIATVEVASFAQVMAWADALGVAHLPHSSSFKDGSSAHSVWVDWQGWHLRVAAYVEPPAPPVVAAMSSREGCPAGCDEQFADTDCAVHGVVALVKAVQR